MFASFTLIALLGVQTFSVPLGKPPPQVERPIAPIETAGPVFDAACDGSDDWDKPAPPVRIFGNTYYVGTCGICSILITGTAGAHPDRRRHGSGRGARSPIISGRSVSG